MTEPKNRYKISPDNPTGKNLFAHLVTDKDGLGYCCVNGFFNCVQATQPIADRLGIASRTVRIHKELWKDDKYPCRQLDSCIVSRIKKGPE